MKQKTNLKLSNKQKSSAKDRTFSSMLKSFKIEGVSFSPKQLKELQSRVQFSK
jgi:hypothetical protein